MKSGSCTFSDVLSQSVPKWIISLIFILGPLFAIFPDTALAGAGITYTGRIFKDETPVNSGVFVFDVWIKSKDNCVLYYERRNIDMSDTNGIYTFEIGSSGASSTSFPQTGIQILSDVFNNTKSRAKGDVDASPPCSTFNPAGDEHRLMSVSFTPVGDSPQTLPDLVLTAVPSAFQAFNANKLNGYDQNHLLRIDPAIANPANSDLDATQLGEFFRLLNNPGTAYLSASSTLSGDVSGPLSAVSVDKIKGKSVDTTGIAANKILKYDGTKWVMGNDDTGAGGGITNLNGLSVGTQSFVVGSAGNAPAITSSGSAHTFDIPMASAAGSVTAGLISNADYSAMMSKQGSGLNSAKVWVGNASNVAEARALSGDVTIDNVGLVTANKTITAQANKLLSLDGSGVGTMNGLALVNTGTVTLSAQTASSTYGLKLPAASPTGNQVLQTDSSGNLSWITALTSSTGYVNGGNSFGANATIGLNDNYALNFETNGSTRMTVANDGNVGINQTQPGSLFHITDTNKAVGSAQANLQIQSSTTGIDNGGNLVFSGEDGASSGRMFASIAGRKENSTSGNYAGYFQIATRANGGSLTERMRVDSTGNVGIGNTSPESLLHVGAGGEFSSSSASKPGGASEQYMTISSSTSGASIAQTIGVMEGSRNTRAEFFVKDAVANSGAWGLWASYGSSGEQPFVIGVNDAEAFRISTNGRVGFGVVPTVGVDMSSKTDALRLPAGNDAARPANATGLLRYNTASNTVEFNNGSTWTNLGSGSGTVTSVSGNNGLTGTVTTSGNIGLASIASNTVLANITGGAAVPTATTVPAMLEAVGSTQGQIMYRDGSAWTVLAPGTSGQLLQTGGAGANPSWVNAPSSLPTQTGNSGKFLTTDGTNASWSAYPDATTSSKGIMQVGSGLAVSSGTVSADYTTAAASNKLLMLDGSGIGSVMGLDIKGTTSGTLSLLAAGTTTSYSLTFPAAQGGSGQVLSNNGSGALSWATALTSSTGYVNGGNSFAATANLGTNDNYDLNIKTNNVTRMTIKKTGAIGVGNTTPWGDFDIYKANASTVMNVVSDNTSSNTARYPTLQIQNFMGSPTTGNGGNPSISLINFRGNSSTSAVMKNGEALGALSFNGSSDTGTNYKEAASIWAFAAQDFSSSAAGGILTFQVTPLNATAAVERMRIDSAGNVGIGTSNPGAKLEVNGSSGSTLKIVDGNQAAGRVLASDANGVASWSTQPYVIGGTFVGVFPASQILTQHPFPINVTIPAGCTNSRFEVNSATTASTVISLQKCTGQGFTSCTQFGTATISAGGAKATFSCASATSFTAGTDSLLITAPASADTTAGTAGWAIYGTR